MRRYEMVKSHAEFNEIIQKIDSEPNFGIAVGKKLGNAVVRNKYKRIFRNIIDNNRFLFPNNFNYIIMIKKEVKSASFQTLENELKSILKKEDINEK